MRGDGSQAEKEMAAQAEFTPHAWGWIEKINAVIYDLEVYPTCVGMDRELGNFSCLWDCLPHMRGDGSLIVDIPEDLHTFTPHAWGWIGYTESWY